ncbi:MAG: DUF3379 domain-containing protein [Gammaproteobacteria bacterium]|nr:DUF3379 domain-containing protein [Gammaproteobacteria bacterium]
MNEKSTINCIDVRRLLLSNPADLEKDTLQHLNICPSCKKAALDASGFDDRLLSALKVPVPDGLANKILLTKGIHENLQQRRARNWFRAVAASIVLTTSIIVSLMYPDSPASVSDIALAHIKAEPHHLQDRKNIKLTKLDKIIKPFNMKINISSQRIHYAGTCKIRRSIGAHIVIQGKKAPLTILLMPDEKVSSRQTINEDNFSGIIVPVKNGSIAIIGDKQEDLNAFEKQIIPQAAT